MQDRIVEIILYLMGEMGRGQRPLGEVNLGPLSERGYTDGEISTAFSWLFDRFAAEGTGVGGSFGRGLGGTTPGRGGSVRVLHEAERMVVTPAAYGYLIQLRALDLLSDHDVEQILERIMMMGPDRVELADIKQLASQIAFDFAEPDRSGSRLTLNGHDTVQ